MAWFRKKCPQPVTAFKERMDFQDRLVKVLEDISTLCMPSTSINPIWELLYRNSLSETLVKKVLISQPDTMLAPGVRSVLERIEGIPIISRDYPDINWHLPMAKLFAEMETRMGEDLILEVSLALGITHGAAVLTTMYYFKELQLRPEASHELFN